MGIEQMRANKAARKKEMEELERLKKELLEEEEEQNGELPEGLTDEKQKVEVVFNRQMSFKSKEQVEMEAALAERVRPLNVVDLEKMDKVQLEDRAKEYWKVIQVSMGRRMNCQRGWRSRTVRSRMQSRDWPRLWRQNRQRRGWIWRDWLWDRE